LLGVGDGSFSGPIVCRGGYGQHLSGAVGDFNGDGHLDMAMASYSDGRVEVMLGDGLGNLTFAKSVSTPSPVSLAAGDVHGDGKPDGVTANQGFDTDLRTVSVLLGVGGDGFVSSQPIAAGISPRSLVLGDFNRDGKLDIATANGYGAGVSVLR